MHHLVCDVIDVGCSFDFHLEAPVMELSSTTPEQTRENEINSPHWMSCHVMSWQRDDTAWHGMLCQMPCHDIFSRKMPCGMLWHGIMYVTYGMSWHRMHMKCFWHGPAGHRVACDKLWYGIAWHCSLHCLHWCHQWLFVDRPVVVIGHVIHSLCNAEEHHSGAVSVRDRFTKVILKHKIWMLLVTVSWKEM